MARFKRRRHKNARAGCLLCHPHKANGRSPSDIFRISELRRLGGRPSRIRRHDLGDEELTRFDG